MSTVRQRRRISLRCAERRGAVIAELAICLPLIVFLVLATIDATTMVFVSHSLTTATYESARVAIADDGTAADAIARGEEVLDDRSVNGGGVTVTPSNVEALDPGTPITITATAPAEANTIIPTLFYSGKTLTATVTMVKE